MANISFELLGKEKVVSILTSLKSRVKNLSPAFRSISDNFRETEKKTFDNQGRGKSWMPLSSTYAAWKAKHYPGRPIMVLTGDLKRSLTSRDANHIERIRHQDMEIGTSDKKGIWHQKGTSKMPARKLISPTASDKMEWVNIIRSYIVEKLGFLRSGF
jgi:phage gpG-like protein